MSRPNSQHRPSVGASSLPVRSSNRAHSHSISLGSLNSSHRVNRRKSSTFSPAANAAAFGAAVESGVADGSVAVNRRGSTAKGVLGSVNDPGYASTPNTLHHGTSIPEDSSEALVDGPSLSSFQTLDKSKQARRASDGTHLTKKEKASTGELKCEQCGKAYKHGSCLNKHRWEHTPQWQVTSKLLISKHQQVQLLEAASVLVAMNVDAPTNDSDNSSSPAASGASDRGEDPSSAETTPPPQVESSYQDSKRLSNTSSAYSRSYQSVFSETGDNSFGHQRQWSSSSANRPYTGNTSIAESYRDEDPQDLAAAVGLLSCSYGTPTSRPTGLPNDVPPVPPLPEKYANRRGGQEDAVMDGDASDEDEDEGMFGKMDA